MKTTCNDRLRQILNDPGRIMTKHLLTHQEVISEPQFREILRLHVRLVVPSGITAELHEDRSTAPANAELLIGDIQLLPLQRRATALP